MQFFYKDRNSYYSVELERKEISLLSFDPGSYLCNITSIASSLWFSSYITKLRRTVCSLIILTGNGHVRNTYSGNAVVGVVSHVAPFYKHTLPTPTMAVYMCRYSSRRAYAHTSAVISMVGYVLGLGDRHGENIMFDSTSGDCVHVDFNCLFNRVRILSCLCCTPPGAIVIMSKTVVLKYNTLQENSDECTQIVLLFVKCVQLCPDVSLVILG